ncbi:hypothetical protein PIB30_018088 [Stylosanthes scabra]|uniref:S-adenosylmethionine decarboxylase proenzyme n=1 Tax=Stylosanthes scabra TaxID=79078 RepID=A0ABU6Y877_9FABA|nr:hypothetical protein [Stylosanthes scabra]
MALSGFEGFEKRLELHFFGDDFQLGLRKIEFESIKLVLEQVQCTVVSAVGNAYFDAYVLSESSLFVYPTKIIIKTCGTTQLLKSIPPLIFFSSLVGFTLSSCRYTRGTFIFPNSQPFPHTSFKDEVSYLEHTIPSNLSFRKASIMPSISSQNHSWHVFTATIPHHHHHHQLNNQLFTMEVCMTDLDPILARKFFRRPDDEKTGHSAGKDMTELTGIDEINPNALICDFAFDPCGYSMNGMDGDWYSTIHVTPEDGFSYASFECVASVNASNIGHVLRKVVQIFRPGTMSVSTTCSGYSDEMWKQMASAVEPLGFKCRSFAMDQFPAAGTVVFQTFSPRRKST